MDCVDFSSYGHLLIIDPERQFSESEIQYIQKMVFFENLSLIIFFEWFDYKIFKEISHKYGIIPNNLFSLNKILSLFGIRLGYRSLTGSVNFQGKDFSYLSGSCIDEFPANNYLFFGNLKDEFEIIYNVKSVFAAKEESLAYLGLFKNFSLEKQTGRIALFGDSTCLEIKENHCLDVLGTILDFLLDKPIPNLDQFLTKSNFYNRQRISNEEDDFFEHYYKTANLTMPIASNCRKHFSSEIDYASTVIRNIEASKPLMSDDLKMLWQLMMMFACVVAPVLVIVAIVQWRKQRRRSYQQVESRIPKYSVIYI